MKKIILSIIISSVSLSVFAGGVFNMQIPQPDFVSNDWDNDGISNNVDDDDDGDGIKDIDDSTPFGQSGQNSTPPVKFNGFFVNTNSINVGQSVTLSWNIENSRKLKIYSDASLENLIADVTGQTSFVHHPTLDTNYYIDYGSGTSNLSVMVSSSVDIVLDKSNVQVAVYKISSGSSNQYDSVATDKYIASTNVASHTNIRYAVKLTFDRPVLIADAYMRGSGAYSGLLCTNFVNTAKASQNRSSCIGSTTSAYNTKIKRYKNSDRIAYGHSPYPKSNIWWMMPNSPKSGWSTYNFIVE